MDPASPPEPNRGYPYATWGPWLAIGGTVLALAAGLILALPILALSGSQSADDLGTTARIGIQAMTAIGFITVPILIAYISGLRLSAVIRKTGDSTKQSADRPTDPGAEAATSEPASLTSADGRQPETLAVTGNMTPEISAAADGPPGPGTWTGAFRALGFTSFRWQQALKWTGITLVGYLAFAMVWAYFFGAPEQEDIAGELGPVWTQILLIVIAAPFAEEICFRGLLFGGIRTKASLPVAALAAGLIFGLLHYSTGWSTVPQLAMLGAAFAVIYDRTGSLWPPILFHMFNNAFVLATLN